jgi:hypothetical protein
MALRLGCSAENRGLGAERFRLIDRHRLRLRTYTLLECSVRRFVTKRILDPGQLLSRDILLARAELVKHVQEIITVPRANDSDPHYEAKGEWNLISDAFESGSVTRPSNWVGCRGLDFEPTTSDPWAHSAQNRRMTAPSCGLRKSRGIQREKLVAGVGFEPTTSGAGRVAPELENDSPGLAGSETTLGDWR